MPGGESIIWGKLEYCSLGQSEQLVEPVTTDTRKPEKPGCLLTILVFLCLYVALGLAGMGIATALIKDREPTCTLASDYYANLTEEQKEQKRICVEERNRYFDELRYARTDAVYLALLAAGLSARPLARRYVNSSRPPS